MFSPSPNQAIPTREDVTTFLPGVVPAISGLRRTASLTSLGLGLSPLAALLLAQAAVFAAAVASGKIPLAVLTLFRALLTL